MEPNDLFVLEIHEKNRSLINSRPNYETLKYFNPNEIEAIFMALKLKVTKSVPTRKSKCILEGGSDIEKCMDEFFMRKMNCSFPWEQNHFLDQCNSSGDVSKLQMIHTALAYTSEYDKELKSLSCMVQNCEQNDWEVHNFHKEERKLNDSNFLIEVDIISKKVTYLEKLD